MSRGNPGQVLLLKDGRKAIAYNRDLPVNGKVIVYVVDEKYKQTGGRLLVDPKTSKIIGYVD